MNLHELYIETGDHLMQDSKPSEFLQRAYYNPLFGRYPFNMLHCLKTTGQSPTHHAEGNVWNHTMLVTDEAAAVRHRSKNPRAFMWAALLHDIGKPAATRVRKGRVTAYDHEKIGAELAIDFLNAFSEEEQFIGEVAGLIRYHMQILFVVKDLPFAEVLAMAEDTDVEEVALLGLCDRLGRAGADRPEEERNIQLFLKKCGASGAGLDLAYR